MSVNINKFDFDQYPDNKATSVDEGLIIKTSVSDIAAESGTAVYPGVSLKFCVFIPRLGGVCSAAYIKLGVLKVSQNISPTTVQNLTWNKNFDLQPYRDEFLLTTTNYSFYFTPTVFFDQAGNTTGSLGSWSLNWIMNVSTATFNLRIPAVNSQIFPCSSFGLAATAFFGTLGDPFYAGQVITRGWDINLGNQKEGYSLCVAQPADLPSRVKQMYPDSWLI